LDEVMAGINDAEREELVDIIRQIKNKETSIMIIGHEVQAVLKLTDRLIVINFGKKIAEGFPNDVICDPEVIEAYLGLEDELVRT
jgi:branched-chain amino acid transport system ATP-binding protein